MGVGRRSRRTRALREKLAARAEPFLDDGETVRQVFMARSGIGPHEKTVNPLAMLRRARNHVVVVTAKGTVVLDATLLRSTRPVAVGGRTRQRVRLGTIKGLWAEVTIDQTYWVHKQFHPEVKAAAARS